MGNSAYLVFNRSLLFQIARVPGSSRLVCFTFSSGWVVSHIIGIFSRSATHCVTESGHSLFPWSLVFLVFAFLRSALLIPVFGVSTLCGCIPDFSLLVDYMHFL